MVKILLWLNIAVIGLVFVLSLILYVLYNKKFQDHKLTVPKFAGKHPIVKKSFTIFLISCIIFGFSMGATNLVTRLTFFREVNGSAEWKRTNGQQYLYIEAEDYYSLGYLEGQYLARQIINTEIVIQSQLPSQYYQNLAFKYLEYIPKNYIEEMQGIADGASFTSGLIINFEDILLQNTFLDIYYGQFIPDNSIGADIMGCTAFGSVNSNGTVLTGQNFDFPTIIGKDGRLPSLAFVHHKFINNDSMPIPDIFSLRIGGMLCIPAARTKEISTVVNVINTNIKSNFSIPGLINVRFALEHAISPEQFIDLLFKGKNQTISFNLMVRNETDLIGVQSNPLSYRLNTNQTIIHTNRYLYEDWNDLYLNTPMYSLNRQNFATELFEERFNDSIFSENELLEVLGTRNGDGTSNWEENSGVLQESTKTATLAFITQNRFGIGNVYDGLGILPF
ncbi:MAG: hypothetical protein ACTSWY_05360 [Promethearchaeota archaeon]